MGMMRLKRAYHGLTFFDSPPPSPPAPPVALHRYVDSAR